MVAGRELNERVATDVMGINLTSDASQEALAKAAFSGSWGSDGKGHGTFRWNGVEYDNVPLPLGGYNNYGNDGYGLLLYTERAGKPWENDLEIHVRNWRDKPKDYSGSIAAAWEVVKKMQENPDPRFRTLRLVAYSYNRTYATFDSRANSFDDDDAWHEANGDDATPLAICLAALKSVGTPVTLGGE